MTLAAVLVHTESPLELQELELLAPGPDEVLVRMAASGVCQSDVSVQKGRLVNPLPLVLGHEGAGTVAALGAHVTNVRVGDRVVLSWLAQCDECFYCRRQQAALCTSAGSAITKATLLDGTTRYRRGGQPIHHMCGLGTFSTHCVVPARSAIPLSDHIPFAEAALIGCGVLTGFGAAVHTGAVAPGEAVAVIGCGGVGLNAIQGARVAGAEIIIAIDPHEERLAIAIELGATLALKPGAKLVKDVRARTDGRGVDVAIEVVGRTETVRDAVRMARPGGRVVLVGTGGEDVKIDIPVSSGIVLSEKTIRGSLYGSCHVPTAVPRLLALYDRGELRLDRLVTRTFAFAEVNDAMAYCASEQGARGVIVF